MSFCDAFDILWLIDNNKFKLSFKINEQNNNGIVNGLKCKCGHELLNVFTFKIKSSMRVVGYSPREGMIKVWTQNNLFHNVVNVRYFIVTRCRY